MAQPLVKKDDDRDEEADYSPFLGIEKGAVLQEARVFHDPQLDARRCSQVITKLLYLLNQGETLTKIEATEVFFAVTKLFQSKDIGLRRMVYLMIKELSPSADEVIIVTSSLMKDMNSRTDLFRANAIRVLCRITDGTLLAQIERYLKQAIVDKNPVVASAALVSGIHLLQTNPEIVRRWSNEVQEAVQSRAALVQFHALALLHQIRQNDRLAVNKLVASLTKGTVRSPLAQCLLIRYISQVIKESGDNSQAGERPFYDYLEGCLRHKAEVVIFEAARTITELSNVTTRELTPAITVLQLFLSSSKPVLRFAALRTLNKVAMTHPMAVTNCNIDMESLISDQNRSIATLAITTLLKTGNESSVDRLMKQITNFMSDIADEFKIVVVEAIRSLCLKFPLKYRSLMNFLSNILREEGGFEYKKAIVDSIVILIRDIPDAKESGLLHLCEFIEDCEFTYLSTQILHFLGNEGPKTSDPSKYIRYIYNRVILENATVRASAVSTLAKFGALVDSLKPRIFVLLRRCVFDNDDEVRDRATLYLNTLGDGSVAETDEDVKEFLFGSLDIPLTNMEASLKNYDPTEEPFDINSVPKEVKSQSVAEKKAPGKKPAASSTPAAAPTSAADAYERLLSSIPEFASFGKLFKSSTPVELTEAETEYSVNVVKHIYDSHVVFQYNCTNTIPEQLLENVTVIVDASDAEEFSEVGTKPLRSLPYDTPGQTFVAFEKPEGVPAVGKFSNVLRFTVKEVDPSTGESEDDGVEDEYQLEDFEVVAADYILKVGVSNFKNAWESLGPDGERIDEYGLGPRESLAEAVNTVINLLGMQPCEGTEVVPSNSRSHTCLLSGIYIGNVKVLVRLSFGIDGAKEVAMKLAVRSEDENVSEAIHEIVASGQRRQNDQLRMIFLEHTRISRELEARKNELDDPEKQLMERGASTENNRLKLKYEKKKHDRAVLNKKKAKKASRLAERYKREKEDLRRKIIQLKVKLDDKPLLEMELIYLRGQTEIVKFTGNYVDVDKLYALLRELHEKEVELYDLEALNHALIVKNAKAMMKYKKLRRN
ncbi:Coatomer subunit gamma-2 [Sesamum angolense]|uniref:Coatomer subunit gamma n=1 Tax=Sesamum angolense TaxID=2727404 RepID=A0AAE1WYE6_9LAMI|nr:Coatomer subunit gamma-2 [Sesamum angolense]